MSLKVLSESDILAVMSVLTREGEESSFLLNDVVRVFERSRLFEVLNDVAFRVEDDGSRSQNREREPEPEAGELRGREAAMAAESDDRDVVGRAPFRLGRRLDRVESAKLEVQVAQAAAKQARASSSRSSRSRRRR